MFADSFCHRIKAGTLTAGEKGVDTMLTVDWRKSFHEGDNPFADMADKCSEAIVKGLCERVELVEPGVTRFYVRG